MAEVLIKSAFVQEWRRDSSEPNPEWAMKVAEVHYKKQGEEYVSTGRTYYTVKSGWGSSFDFRKFKAGDKVTITGNLVTESREYNRKTYYDLVVKANAVDIVQSDNSEATRQRKFANEEPF